MLLMEEFFTLIFFENSTTLDNFLENISLLVFFFGEKEDVWDPFYMAFFTLFFRVIGPVVGSRGDFRRDEFLCDRRERSVSGGDCKDSFFSAKERYEKTNVHQCCQFYHFENSIHIWPKKTYECQLIVDASYGQGCLRSQDDLAHSLGGGNRSRWFSRKPLPDRHPF